MNGTLEKKFNKYPTVALCVFSSAPVCFCLCLFVCVYVRCAVHKIISLLELIRQLRSH